MFPDIIENDGLCRGGRVYTISLEHGKVIAKTFEHEWRQSKLVALRKLWINCVKLLRIGWPVVRGQAHADEQYLGPAQLAGFDNALQIIARGFDGLPAQTVVAAQFDDDD